MANSRKVEAWTDAPQEWVKYFLTDAEARTQAEDQAAAANGFSAMYEHETIRAAFFAFAYVVAKLSAGRERFSILDFGGALGLYVNIARQAASCPIAYAVVDLAAIAEAGAKLRPDVRFMSALDETRYDLVLASGAVQCVEDWRGVLAKLAKASDHVFLTRTPVLYDADSFIMAQPLPAGGIACSWCWNERELLAGASESGLRMIEEFRFQETYVPIDEAPELPRLRGYLFSSQ